MSTRARIGIPTPEGVESIYVHFDGYPEGVGEKLATHWVTSDKVRELIDLGDLSILGEDVGEKHPFHIDHGTQATEAELRMCLAYGRDRGEQDVGSKTHSLDNWPDYGQEYEYLAVLGEDGEVSWLVREAAYGGEPKGQWVEITK